MFDGLGRAALAAAAGLVLAAGPALADITITMESTSPGGNMSSTLSISGMKMREDSKISGGVAEQFGSDSFENSRIVDLEASRTVNFSSFEKQAIVQDKESFERAEKQGAGGAEPTIALRETGEKRQVAGHDCDVYNIEASIPLSSVMPQDLTKIPGMAQMLGGAVMAMKGTTCLAADAPGWDEYRAYYAAASAFSRKTASPDGPANVLIGAMAEKGIMVEMSLEGALEGGDGAAIPMLSQIVASFATISMKVTSISLDAVPASRFEIPSGLPVTKISY